MTGLSPTACYAESYKGTNQSRLSKMVRPPKEFPHGTPAILWLVGFFPLMAFVDRGKLSFATGLVSVGYVLVLPALLVAAFVYNSAVYPPKYQAGRARSAESCARPSSGRPADRWHCTYTHSIGSSGLFRSTSRGFMLRLVMRGD
jgi:hypothetical protein